jgi:amino acid transporter
MAQGISTGGTGGAPPTLFLRKATGLVREMSIWDAFNINMTNANAWANIAILLPLGLVLFAGANLWLSVVTGTILGMAVVLVYTMLAQAMPRSGGDYVFISRALNPAIGFVATWTMAILCAFFSAFNAWSMGNWLLPDLFAPLGVMTGNQSLINLATWVAQPWVVIAIVVISVALWFLIMYRGARFAARTQWISVVFIVAAAIVGVPILLSTSPDAYVKSFDSFAAHFNTSAAAMEALATKGGTNLNPPFSLSATLGFWPFVMVIFGYAINSIMVGGEIRSPRRAQYVSVIGSTVASAAILALFLALGVSRIPSSLMTAFGYFTYVTPADNPMPFTLYGHVPMALATSSPLFLILLTGAVGFGLWFASIGLFFWATRYMFAWAIDRVAPPQVAALRGSRNAPVTALVVISLVTIGFGVMLEQVPNFSYVAGALLEALLILFACIAAIVFPYRLKSLYKASIKWEFAGIPIITILGVWGTAFMLVMVYFYITNSAFGTVTGTSLQFSAGAIISGIVYYAVAYFVARRKGYNLALTYREIPPE